ncbi:hypothetical protein ACFL0T_08500 [Candidatus Omnitrophota bacterium]
MATFKKSGKEIQLGKRSILIWAGIDPRDPETVLGAYIHNFAVIGSIATPILGAIFCCLFIDPAFFAIAFLLLGPFVGLLFGGAAGSIAGRIVMRNYPKDVIDD